MQRDPNQFEVVKRRQDEPKQWFYWAAGLKTVKKGSEKRFTETQTQKFTFEQELNFFRPYDYYD